MCEAKMDTESPEEGGKQMAVDMKSTSADSPPRPPSSQPTPPSSIRHCPLTPQSQMAEEDEGEELDYSEHEESEDGRRRSDRNHSSNSGNNHHHHLHNLHLSHGHGGSSNSRARRRHHHEEYEDTDNVTTDEDDMISVGGSPSPNMSPSPQNLHHHHNELNSIKRNHNHIMKKPEDEYFKPLKKLRMLKMESSANQNAVGVKSFSITDILSHKPSAKNHTTSNCSSASSNSSSRTIDIENVAVHHHHHHHHQQRIVRPWDPHQSSKSNGRRNSSDSSPLDALFQMTSKTFEGLNGHHESSEFGGQGNAHQGFNSRQPPKKKRKSRTAFTNHQIFELEKRFLYQKYLSPADRDEIAHQLGLTNAQVITWFQNRRAKLKRDMEEMKKDMESQNIISAHKTFLESAHDLALLKKRAQSHMDMNSAAVAAAAVAASSFPMSSPTSSSQSSHSPINLTSESPPSTH